eukprot:Trichotokara_eunicae@DN4265_c0_g1_i22.p1
MLFRFPGKRFAAEGCSVLCYYSYDSNDNYFRVVPDYPRQAVFAAPFAANEAITGIPLKKGMGNAEPGFGVVVFSEGMMLTETGTIMTGGFVPPIN